MSLIDVRHLTFGYDGSPDNVFEDVSFQLDTGWKLGFIGRNGRGKTTFLRLLMGQMAYGGTIAASTDFRYFPCPVEDRQAKAWQVALQGAGDCEQWQLQRELSLLKVPEEALDRPFATLSGGEQTRLLMAALFAGEGAFPLIDEPTNHLDQQGRRQLARYLRGKEGFLLVSHDRDFLDACVDHILSINRRTIQVQAGNFSTWQQNRQQQDALELQQNEKLKKEIRRMEEAARRTSGWSDAVEKTKKGSRNAGLRPDRGYIGHKSAKMMQRAKNLERRQQQSIQQKKSLLQDAELEASLALQPREAPKRRLLEARGLVLYQGGRPLCRPLDLTLEQGERLAILGRNGAGKSTLLRLCAGEDVAYTGSFYRAPGLEQNIVPQQTHHLRGGLRDLARQQQVEESLLLALLRQMGLERRHLERPVEQMSEGQRKKVLLALAFCRPYMLYLWDEPMNYIDVITRMQLEEAVQDSRATIVFVEHDSAFVRHTATKTVELAPFSQG